MFTFSVLRRRHDLPPSAEAAGPSRPSTLLEPVDEDQ
jgi:hypothetical protein